MHGERSRAGEHRDSDRDGRGAGRSQSL